MSLLRCPSCESPLKGGAKFCPACGTKITTADEHPKIRSQIHFAGTSSRRTISKRARSLYGILAASLCVLFTLIFLNHIPGGENAVIAGQPENAMASSDPDKTLTPQPVDPSIENGKITFPLALLLEKKMLQFDYRSSSTTIPLVAFISSEGKLVTAIRLCEPCNSKTFRIEGNELACGNCETRWKLSNLEGIQGSCQKYPPDPIPSTLEGNRVVIEEAAVKNWKMRI